MNVRNACALAAAFLTVLFALSGYAQTPAPAAVPHAPDPWVEVVKALAWPLGALSIAVVFYRPVERFLTAIGGRITKLSVFKVELELVAAKSATATPLFDYVRTATTAAEISDSSRTMLEQVQSGTPADFAVVGIGAGKEWLTSRLFIAAVMTQRMRGLQALVFVERVPPAERRLVAVASVGQVRWVLARRYPWLEAAWACANLSVFNAPAPAGAPALANGLSWPPDPRTLLAQTVITSDTGAVEPLAAGNAVRKFIDSLQQDSVPAAPADPAEWVHLGGSKYERAAYVTRELLALMLPQEALGAWTDALKDAPRAQRTRAVLRRPGDFVALVEGDREFTRLANRRVLLEEIAAAFGEEPEK